MSNNVQGTNALNKPIGRTKGKYPDKEVINFIKGDKKKSDGKALAVFALFMAGVLVFVYFGVIKQLDKIDEAERNYNQVQAELDEYKDQIASMSDIEEEYNSRVEMYYTDEEAQYSNRTEIIDMISEDILPYLDKVSVAVSSDNKIIITANQADFTTVGSVLKILQDDDRIDYVKVNTAGQSSDESDVTTVDAQYEITWNVNGNEVEEDA